MLFLCGGAFSSRPERLSQGPSLGKKRYSKEPGLTFQQHFLSACRPAKSRSKRALGKVDRTPAQTIVEPMTATLAPVFLSELSPSSKPESTWAPSVAWPTSHAAAPAPRGQPLVAGWISVGFPPHVGSGHGRRRKRRDSPAAWERSPSH